MHRARRAGVLVAGLLTLVHPCRSGAQDPAPRHAGPSPVEFEADPARIESLGLTVPVPAGSVAETVRVGTMPSLRIAPPGKAWIIDVQAMTSPELTDTAEGLTDRVSQLLISGVQKVDRDGKAISPTGQLLVRETNLRIEAGPAERAYVAVPQGAGPALIRGVTILRTGPGRFVGFNLTVDEPGFVAARRVYETVVAAAKFEESEALMLDRAASVRAGVTLLRGLTEADYRELLAANPDRWDRMVRLSSTGAPADDEELGYRRVRAWAGARGEIDPARTAASGLAAERDEGFLVRVDFRLLDQGAVIDSTATFFATPDFGSESWQISTARRPVERSGGVLRLADARPATWMLLGGRDGDSMMIDIRGSGEAPRSIRPTIEGEGYLSQVQAYLLPQLLARSGIAASYAFYSFHAPSAMIRLRRDVLDPPGEDADLWRLTTRLTEDSQPQVTLLRAGGGFERIDLPDGAVWLPTSLDELARLWKSKGLPMD